MRWLKISHFTAALRRRRAYCHRVHDETHRSVPPHAFIHSKEEILLSTQRSKKLQNPGPVYDSVLSFLVIGSTFITGEIICEDKWLCSSRRADLMVQRETRVPSPPVSSTSCTEETSAVLVLIRSKIIPIPAFILRKSVSARQTPTDFNTR